MSSAQRWLQISGALIVLAWMYAGAGDGLNASFTTDDLVNMTSYQSRTSLELVRDNFLYFSPSYRPMGALFYSPLFAWFGLSPLPFRIVSFVLLTINLGLAFAVFRSITESSHTAALGTLIFAFHPRLVDLYWSSGTIYDILCFTFICCSFLLYLRARTRGARHGWKTVAGCLLLYLCALDTKEIAVVLPVLFLAYELLYHKPNRVYLPVIAISAAMTIPYVIGKQQSQSPFAQLERYQPQFSATQFLHTYGAYLNDIFYTSWFVSEWRTAAFLLATLLIAVACKSRNAGFAWVFAVLGSIPIALIPPRPAFAFYLPFAGWCLYAAIGLACLGRAALHRQPAILRQAAIFLLTLALLWRVHRIQRLRMGGPAILGQQIIRTVLDDLNSKHVLIPTGARVLVIQDPFGAQGYDMLMFLRLYTGDPTLDVDRGSTDDGQHAAVLQFNGRSLIQAKF
jgi:hypothetical protein